MPAVLFGSISTLIDTSELQRQAFNDAFVEHGLDWKWERDEYRAMLGRNGGAQRIADYAAKRGEDVDVDAIHATKSQRFRELLAQRVEAGEVKPRDGVADVIEQAHAAGARLGVVTTTSAENVDAILKALSPTINADRFDVRLNSSDVGDNKPDPAVYLKALEQLGETADNVVAIEDNPGGVASARGAQLRCIAFPNENTADEDFSAASETVISLDARRVVDPILPPTIA